MMKIAEIALLCHADLPPGGEASVPTKPINGLIKGLKTRYNLGSATSIAPLHSSCKSCKSRLKKTIYIFEY
jgi:hypothetical protein